MRLTTAGRVLRGGHLLIAVVELSCLGYLWLCALTNRRGRALWVCLRRLGPAQDTLTPSAACRWEDVRRPQCKVAA
jgi:hypothetical protein